jgi:BirA family biotin operon repressor/biotin-[acetyl-CoA-carboxylase] ligase
VRGYSEQALTADRVRAALGVREFGRTFHILEETVSTNTAALALARKGARHGTVVLAEQQTAGRGRLGRPWYSPPGENLYCSVILRKVPRPDRLAHWLTWIPLVSGAAANEAVEQVTGLHPSLKWPNDVLIGDKKLGGVLCESQSSHTQGTIVVIGIGINVNTKREGFPEHLQELATSVAIETGRSFDRTLLLDALLAKLEQYAELLIRGQTEAINHKYTALCSTLGRRVLVSLAQGEGVEGLADSISSDGSLRILCDRTQVETMLEVRAGDVIHLRDVKR